MRLRFLLAVWETGGKALERAARGASRASAGEGVEHHEHAISLLGIIFCIFVYIKPKRKFNKYYMY